VAHLDLLHAVGDWSLRETRRNFFDNFANGKNFDPSDTEHWYSITLKDILSAGGVGVLYHHKRSHIEALIDLYPELSMKRNMFLNSARAHSFRIT